MAATDVKVPERKRISDLFKQGDSVVLKDDEGNEIPVWVQNLSPLELKAAMKAASKARAVHRAMKNLKDDEIERAAYISEHELKQMKFDRQSLIDFLGGAESVENRGTYEAEIGAEEEWSKDDYLEGLIEAWNGDTEQGIAPLQDAYLIDNDDEEASRVHDELMRFTQQVKDRLDADFKKFEKDHLGIPDEDLLNEVLDILIDAEAEDIWFEEYRRQQVFYATRLIDNHRVRYFPDREEIDSCDGRSLRQILDVVDQLNVNATEGKG